MALSFSCPARVHSPLWLPCLVAMPCFSGIDSDQAQAQTFIERILKQDAQKAKQHRKRPAVKRSQKKPASKQQTATQSESAPAKAETKPAPMIPVPTPAPRPENTATKGQNRKLHPFQRKSRRQNPKINRWPSLLLQPRPRQPRQNRLIIRSRWTKNCKKRNPPPINSQSRKGRARLSGILPGADIRRCRGQAAASDQGWRAMRRSLSVVTDRHWQGRPFKICQCRHHKLRNGSHAGAVEQRGDQGSQRCLWTGFENR